jgi:outer membrane protein
MTAAALALLLLAQATPPPPAAAARAIPALSPQDTTRLTLGEALRGALARYPTLGAARAVRDQAAAGVAEARAPLLPRLALDASLTRYQLPGIVYPLHSLNITSPGQLPVFDRTLVQGSASLSWTLWDFGARSGRVRAARASERASDAAVDATESALLARVAGAYLRVLTLEGTLRAQDQQLEALTAEADRVHQLLAVGRAARVEVLRIEATVTRARAEREATVANLEVAERDLAQLAGVPVDRARGPLLTPLGLREESPPPDRAVVLARAGEANPDLAQARRAAEAGRAQLAAVQATRFPELRLLGAWIDRGSAQGEFKDEWQAGVALSWPLFTGGQRAAQIRRADADFRARTELLRQAQLALEQGVDRALGTLREGHARLVALSTAVDQFDEVARIRRLALQAGSGTQTDYLDAVSDLLRARASLVEARHVEIAARIELARVSGELTPQWLAAEIVAQ